MKRVTAYVNTTRVHWLAEELVASGVKQIRVVEHFSPTSQISRLQLCCEEDLVDEAKRVIRRLGSTGSPPDFDMVVSEFQPDAPGRIPVGQRMSVLEEPQLARHILSLFRGATTKLTLVFLVITLSISAVGVWTHIRLEKFQRDARASAANVRTVVDAAGTIRAAHFEEMLAAELLHRGDSQNAVQDFRIARERLANAVGALQESRLVESRTVDSLVEMEKAFQSITDGMFGILARLSYSPERQNNAQRSRLSQSHADIMIALDQLHHKCMDLLASLEGAVSEVARTNDADNSRALNGVRLSLTLLAGAAMILAALMWYVTRRKVSQPLNVLVEEARSLDDGELK